MHGLPYAHSCMMQQRLQNAEDITQARGCRMLLCGLAALVASVALGYGRVLASVIVVVIVYGAVLRCRTARAHDRLHVHVRAHDTSLFCVEISQLQTKTLSACTECEGVCAVCQSEWEEGDEVRVLPCGHQFHTGCVDRWLGQHKACCPLCKADVCPSAEAGRGEGRQRGAQRAAVGAAATGGAMAAEILESQCPIVYTL
jgi:hypothetical protein